MIKRRKTKLVEVGPVIIGSQAPIVIQSMTKVPTTEINRCLRQINQLSRAGCRLVRVAVATRADTLAFEKIVQRADVPLIADVHFSPRRAIEAIEAGAAKIRLNPGNIKDPRHIRQIIDAARVHRIAIRIGINEASIADYQKQYVAPQKRAALMVREMRRYVRLFEKRRFDQLVLSAKSHQPLRSIEVNRRIAQIFDYPIHLGLTHAGLPEDAQSPSAITIGTLLAEGIGDTIRVSAAADPLLETEMAKQILTALGLYKPAAAELIVCPTCARAEVDIIKLARQVKKAIARIDKPLRVAVMGCIVNGPGEAADADLAVCAARNKGYIYRQGQKISTVPGNRIIPALLKELQKL